MDVERRIGDMHIGETAYIVPWAVHVDGDETVYLILDYHRVYEKPGGTSDLRIKRLSEDVFICKRADIEPRHLKPRAILRPGVYLIDGVLKIITHGPVNLYGARLLFEEDRHILPDV